MEQLRTDIPRAGEARSKQGQKPLEWPFPKGEDKSHLWRKLPEEADRLAIVRSFTRQRFTELNKGA